MAVGDRIKRAWGETLMLGTDDSVDELTRKGLQVIVKEAGRLEGFVEELLDFSRLQSGRMNLRLAKTDLFAELDETVFTFRERALRDGIEVKYSIPEVPAIANADANRLKQVFMNILDNALKYSRSPSKIFVKAEFTKLDNQNFVKIAIADQGCGISKEDLPHVKEKFYKANVSVRGSGIGLAVTNEIVNLHHGKLEIDSQEGKGTLVTIYLPVENSPTKNELNDMKQNETAAASTVVIVVALLVPAVLCRLVLLLLCLLVLAILALLLLTDLALILVLLGHFCLRFSAHGLSPAIFPCAEKEITGQRQIFAAEDRLPGKGENMRRYGETACGCFSKNKVYQPHRPGNSAAQQDARQCGNAPRRQRPLPAAGLFADGETGGGAGKMEQQKQQHTERRHRCPAVCR